MDDDRDLFACPICRGIVMSLRPNGLCFDCDEEQAGHAIEWVCDAAEAVNDLADDLDELDDSRRW